MLFPRLNPPLQAIRKAYKGDKRMKKDVFYKPCALLCIALITLCAACGCAEEKPVPASEYLRAAKPSSEISRWALKIPPPPPELIVLPTADIEIIKPPEVSFYFPESVNQGQDSGIEILSVTSPVSPGDKATVSIKGAPGAEYKIKVIYHSGPSKAKGLSKKTADSAGAVSWTWNVGSKTRPGEYEIVISGGGKSVKTTFTVG